MLEKGTKLHLLKGGASYHVWTYFKYHITIGHLFCNTIFIFLIQYDPELLTGEVNVSDARVLL